MSATTIKLEGDLVEQIRDAKEDGKSVTAFVKDLIHAELSRRRLRSAAQAYRQFINDDPEERESLLEWGEADLAEPPTRSQT